MNSPSEQRDHGDNRSYERPVDWTGTPEDREHRTHQQHAADASLMQLPSPQPNPWPSSLTE